MTMQWNTLTRRAALAGLAMAALASPVFAETAPQVKFETSLGNFVVEVYPDKAPKTVENFLLYVKSKQYDGTIFHRVIPNFMVQGGGYTKTMSEQPTRPPVPLEAQNGLKNDLGTVAMARTPEPNSAKAQFFVNVKNNDFLNAKGPSDGYTVFGKVISGMDVVHKINAAPTGPGDVPQTQIVINSATLVK
jgi:peptidyl-prolyl cis-trans isomerase A (cyclophilin A)